MGDTIKQEAKAIASRIYDLRSDQKILNAIEKEAVAMLRSITVKIDGVCKFDSVASSETDWKTVAETLFLQYNVDAAEAKALIAANTKQASYETLVFENGYFAQKPIHILKFLTKADEYFVNEDYDEAITSYTAALEKDPDCLEARIWRARAYLCKSINYDDEYFSKAIAELKVAVPEIVQWCIEPIEIAKRALENEGKCFNGELPF
ncbi:MAG: tetratricopeptide repeat protein [Fibromonadaceae bacterium]|jgi:tetratricopeptide (TPR) repeat protein|nr:tetratricopeptide repeat protein [Fibromonadaceae bacterium]